MSADLIVKVVPRSSQERVELQADGTIKVWVHAAPTGGQANTAVCKLIAKALDIPKSKVEVLRGETARIKTIRVSDLEPSEALKRLS